MAEPRPAFLFDGSLCTGCEACRVACGNANRDGADTGWRQIHTFNPRRHPRFPTLHLSLACNHCDIPACLLGCPAAAYGRDPVTGAVLLAEDRCLGCRYCSWLCPYGAPRFDAARGVMSKCTFCAERLAAGGEPACTQACPTGALRFGGRPTPPVEVPHPALPATGLGPALAVAPPRRHGPVVVAPAAVTGSPPLQPAPDPSIRPADEWTLVLFSVALPWLVAWFAAGLLRPDRQPEPWAFSTVAGLALAVSVLHLGRPRRAWRAVANPRTSWLSREILFSGLFVAAAATASALSGRAAGAASGLAVTLGAAALVAVDRVYAAVPRLTGPRGPHSAGALVTGVFLAAVAAGIGAVALPLAAVRAWLFVQRRPRLPRAAAALRPILLVAAAAAGWVPDLDWPVAVVLALSGELIDRIAFYGELEPTSPAAAMALAATHPTEREWT